MSGLAGIFSSTNIAKFERKLKPEEFDSKQKEPLTEEEIIANDEKERRLEKKAKKKRKLEDMEKEAARAKESATEPEKDAAADERVGTNGDQSTGNQSNDTRTLFVGNIPIEETIKSLGVMFKEFGEIESIRLRSVPIAGAKIDDAGNQDKVRRVSTNQRKFGDQKGSFNAYIVFKEEASVGAALAANNRVVGTRHLRCDRLPPTLFNQKHSVFVGSLPHYTDEEELRVHFAKVLAEGQEDILSVRLIRDPESLLCKGVGYILFRDPECVMRALSLHEKDFKRRQLRVTTCGKRTKRTEARRAGKDPLEARPNKFSGKVASEVVVRATNAMKRIENKKRGKATRGSGNNGGNKKPEKKSKRLGGVIKRAMKEMKGK